MKVLEHKRKFSNTTDIAITAVVSGRELLQVEASQNSDLQTDRICDDIILISGVSM